MTLQRDLLRSLAQTPSRASVMEASDASLAGELLYRALEENSKSAKAQIRAIARRLEQSAKPRHNLPKKGATP